MKTGATRRIVTDEEVLGATLNAAKLPNAKTA
jgi:hypothetical protein